MTIDKNIAIFLENLQPPHSSSLEELRTETDRSLVEMHGPLEQVDRIETIKTDGQVALRAYWPLHERRERPQPAIVFAHAGGWCLVSLNTYDNPCCALANATGCVVFSVEYRLAPEYQYPIPMEDFYNALCWIAANAAQLGIDPRKISVAGDSAGGNLAAAAALLARDRGGPHIAHQLLMYPPLDLDFKTVSYEEFADGFYLTRDTMKFCWQTYLGENFRQPSEYAAPLRADLRGLPSATIIVNEFDPLRSEGEAFARKLKESSVPVKIHCLKGLIHGCLHMTGISSSAEQIFRIAAMEIRNIFGLPLKRCL